MTIIAKGYVKRDSTGQHYLEDDIRLIGPRWLAIGNWAKVYLHEIITISLEQSGEGNVKGQDNPNL